MQETGFSVETETPFEVSHVYMYIYIYMYIAMCAVTLAFSILHFTFPYSIPPLPRRSSPMSWPILVARLWTRLTSNLPSTVYVGSNNVPIFINHNAWRNKYDLFS